MEPNPPSLRLNQAQQQAPQTQSQQAQPGHQFASVDEMMRWDAAQTQPPPGLEDRVRRSVEREPRPRRSWWRRIFEMRRED